MKLTLALVACVLCLGCHLGMAAESANPCNAADAAEGTVVALPHVSEALKAGSTLNVLAIGSATIFGPEAAFLPGTVTNQVTN